MLINIAVVFGNNCIINVLNFSIDNQIVKYNLIYYKHILQNNNNFTQN
jgi:hypothetical protein